MYSTRKINLIHLFVLFLIVAGPAGTIQARSVYVITDRSSTVAAYDIQGDQIVGPNATAQNLPDHGGAVGLALDPDSETLFVTYEGSNIIEMVNAKTMISEENPVTVPGVGASGLAGLAFDQSKQKLYVVERMTNGLYVYFYDQGNNTLILEQYCELVLPYPGEYVTAWGIALDEQSGLLYVSNAHEYVDVFSTSDWSHDHYIEIKVNDTPREAVGIALDPTRNYIYTGAFTGTAGQHYYLVRTDVADINEPVSIEKYIGTYVIGLTTDINTGLIYTTTYNNHIEVYNAATFPNENPSDTETEGISSPGDIIVRGDVSYKPPFPYLTLVKDNNDVDCVYPYDVNDDNYLIYRIEYDANGYGGTEAIITDYLPFDVNYHSSDPCGVYDPCLHSVSWSIDSISPSDSNSFEIVTKVTWYAKPGGTIRNICEIESNEYYSIAIEDTNICCYSGDIIYVDKDANGFNNGTSWDNAYTDLQDALAQARSCSGITDIWVAEGIYKPVWWTDSSGTYKDISFDLIEGVGLFGHFGGIGTYETSTSQRNFADANNETFLEGQIGDNYDEAVKYIVTADGIEESIVDGFTIRGSYGSDAAGIFLYDSGVEICNCKLEDNDDFGVYNTYFSYPDVHNCTFADNTTHGIYVTDNCWPEISYCTFDGNDTTSKGIYFSNSVVGVENSLFKNHVDDGIYGSNGTLIVIDSNFIGNTNNGLKTNSGCDLVLKNSEISYNGEDGICLLNNYVTKITNNWIHNNGTSQSEYGAGIYLENQVSVPLIRNNTICANNTYGIEASEQGADPNIINCIIYGNDSNDLYRTSGTFDTVNYCCLQDEHTGTGNINDDPCFIDETNDNYHLRHDSNCIDTGDPDFVPDANETDIDGDPRIRYNRVDMGADEACNCLGDIDSDGDNDAADMTLLMLYLFNHGADANNGWTADPPIPPCDCNDLCECYECMDLNRDGVLSAADMTLFMLHLFNNGGNDQNGWEADCCFELCGETYCECNGRESGQKELDFETMAKWLREISLEPEVRNDIDEDEWFKFIESLIETLKEQMQN